MKRRLALAAIALSAIACGHTAPVSSTNMTRARAPVAGPLSFVVTNAKVYADGAGTGVDAVAVSGTRIAAVGTSAALARECTSPCVIVDAKGGFLSPGFHDAHVHLAHAGEATFELRVPPGPMPAIQRAVREYAAAHPDEPWITGGGWSAWHASSLPDRAALDTAESVRPVALTDHSGHNMWANTAALRAAGITKATPDPFGGRILHDASGEPTGMLVDGAQRLVRAKMPAASDEEREKFLLTGEQMSLHAACTSMEGGPATFEQAHTYARLDREGKLTQRAFLWAPLLAREEDFARWALLARELPRDGKVQIVAFKGFADGTFSASTAALLAPYADDPTKDGELYVAQDMMNRAVVRANRAGFPAAIHAIGDRAVRSALDAFAYSNRTLGRRDLVNRVEHASMVHPDDARRFGPLGVAASVQPVWLAGFSSRAAFTIEAHVGAARSSEIYPWNDLAAGGALLLFGSDMPSGYVLDPIAGIHAAVARELLSGEVFQPKERIGADLAYRAYTVNPAFAIGWGERLGRIAAGYEADLVLLDKDPRDARGLKDDPLRAVWVAGRTVPL